ncbi:MAG: Na(+)-translocating NADH-quinone reductase subunit A [Paracoccaceae bacterium]
MIDFAFNAGLTPRFSSPAFGTQPTKMITAEAGLRTFRGDPPRVVLEVEEDALVPQGAPIARLRTAPDVCFVSPMPARVARITLSRGHRLSEIVLFHEAGGDTVSHDIAEVETEAGLRRLMQNSGLWLWLERRPFGGMPAPEERPGAIFVMASDTTPLAPDPRLALVDREESFGRGLHALSRLTDGPVFVCQQPGPALFDGASPAGRLRLVEHGPRHPQGAAGLRIHALFPATLETPVWSIHAEDVAHLGTLIATGTLPMTRLVSVAGAALREARLVHTQPGADLRGLTHRIVQPGPHVVLSGSPLDGHPAHWLAPRHRQVTAWPRPPQAKPAHWFVAALTRSATPKPMIPNAALDQSFAATLPAAAFVRTVTSGNDETAMKMGLLSLLEEDVALADYVLGRDVHLPDVLRVMLDRIRAEFAA